MLTVEFSCADISTAKIVVYLDKKYLQNPFYFLYDLDYRTRAASVKKILRCHS